MSVSDPIVSRVAARYRALYANRGSVIGEIGRILDALPAALSELHREQQVTATQHLRTTRGLRDADSAVSKLTAAYREIQADTAKLASVLGEPERDVATKLVRDVSLDEQGLRTADDPALRAHLIRIKGLWGKLASWVTPRSRTACGVSCACGGTCGGVGACACMTCGGDKGYR